MEAIAMDESVMIAFKYKRREGGKGPLRTVFSRSLTLRNVPLEKVDATLKKVFQPELAKTANGIYRHADKAVLAQMQHYTRDPETHNLRYAASKSLTIPGVGLKTVVPRALKAFSKKK
jgi:hypothetical protein